MKFVCPEVEAAKTSQEAAKVILNFIFQNRINENLDSFEDTLGVWKRLSRKFSVKEGYTQSYFALTKQIPILGNIGLDSSSKTIAQLAIALNIDIELSYIELEAFNWRIRNSFDLYKLPYWITIYKEDGILLAKPEITADSTYRGEITEKDVIYRTTLGCTVGYQGELGFDISIAADTTLVSPTLINSVFKDQTLNKYSAVRDVIYFIAGFDASPLDWVQGPDRGLYLIVSKKQDERDLDFLYTAVREYKDSRSYSGGDVTPVMYSLGGGGSTIVDDYTHSGASLNRFNLEGLDLKTDVMYEWFVDFNYMSGNNGIAVAFNTTTGTSYTNYVRGGSSLVNGVETNYIANNDARIIANDSLKPLVFHARIYLEASASGQYFIRMDWEYMRYRSAYNTDIYQTGFLSYRANQSNLTILSLYKWTGSPIIVPGFRSLLLKSKV